MRNDFQGRFHVFVLNKVCLTEPWALREQAEIMLHIGRDITSLGRDHEKDESATEVSYLLPGLRVNA